VNDAAVPDPTRDASGDDAAPDPMSDAWSAWLPDLGPRDLSAPASPASPSNPSNPAPPPPTPPPNPPSSPAAPALPHLPPPRDPQASFSITVSQRGGRSYSTGWTYGAGRPARPVVPVAPGQPPTYLGLALLALVIFAVPFGLVALVRSLQVSPHWAAGRYEQARTASRSARRWSVAALVAVSCLFLLGPLLSVLVMVKVR